MNIEVIGDKAAVGVLRGYLDSLGYGSAGTPNYRVTLEHADQANIRLQGSAGDFAESAIAQIKELTAAPIEWREVAGGSDRDLHVTLGPNESDAVERGLLRALLKLTGHGQTQPNALAAWLAKLRK